MKRKRSLFFRLKFPTEEQAFAEFKEQLFAW
jgi:hypothetical protein